MSTPAGSLGRGTTRGPLSRLRRWLLTFLVGVAVGVVAGATAAQQVVDRLEDHAEPLLA